MNKLKCWSSQSGSNPAGLIDDKLLAILDVLHYEQAGESAALAAAANDHSETLCLLLDRGADVNDVYSVRGVTAIRFDLLTALDLSVLYWP